MPVDLAPQLGTAPEVTAQEVAPQELVLKDRAMATRLLVRVNPAGLRPGGRIEALVAEALDVFHAVDRQCTRFDPQSPLMQANRQPVGWHRVPPYLFAALREAKVAHDRTEGMFDPRVLRCLVSLGYGRSLSFPEQGRLYLAGESRPVPCQGRWEPGFRPDEGAVDLGGEPVDLGGIGKGLAVRWAGEVLVRQADNFLVEAGGDCYCAGCPADGPVWRVGVEDPADPRQHLCVLGLTDVAVTTSSVRLRQWTVGKKRAHHIIDPRTGLPGGAGLVSVTVVDEDPAGAEVWSKCLFLTGAVEIAAAARRASRAALWVDETGSMGMTAQMRPYVLWRRH